MSPARTYLYVPGRMPERLAKAHLRGADVIVADLEDSVADETKSPALCTIETRLAGRGKRAAWVRVNLGERGVEEFARLAHDSLAGLFLPKLDDAAQLAVVSDQFRRFGRTLRLADTLARE